MAGYFRNVDRYGSETNNNSALDFNPVPIGYTPSASGNTANLNSFVIDPNGDMYFIDSNGDSFYINTSNPLDVLSGVQPTPTGSGNTTNLNSVFKDANGDTWIVDWKGDAVKAGSAAVAETITTITDTVTTGHLIGSYTNEAGVTVDLNETLTVLKTFSIVGNTITLEYVDESGTTTTKTVDVPADVVTTLTNALTAGHKIGTYTNETGAVIDLYETVTSVSDFSIAGSTITLKYVDETGIENTKSFDLPAVVAETVTTLTNALSTGNKIGTYTNESGVNVVLNETITTLQTFSITGNVITLEYVAEDGLTTTKTVTVPTDVITTITNALTTGNKIGTYTNESGTVVDLYETITSVTEFDYDAVSGTLMLTYKDEAGVDNSLQTNIPIQVITTLTNALIAGNKIGTYTNESGTVVDIYETVTTLVDNGNGTFTYTNESGSSVTISIGGSGSETNTTITNTVTGHKIATYTNEQATAVDINETITSLSLSNSTLTYVDEAGVSNAVSLSTIKGDTYKTNSTTCQDIVASGNITVTVATGLAYTPLQDIILYHDATNHMHGEVVSYDAATGVLVMNVHQKTGAGNYCTWVANLDGFQVSELSVSFGTSAPTSAGVEGDEYFITSDGTSTGTITAQYIYDATTASWILRPSTVYANWTDVTSDPSATGNTGTLPRFVSNTVNGSKWYIDANGVAKLIEGTADNCLTIYFNSTDPSTATIFDTANPPVTNNDAYKLKDCYIYIGTDGSFWSSNGTTYATKTFSFPLHRMEAFFATAGQTTFTLSKTPIGDTKYVHVTRNGIDITVAWSWVGNVGTYIPANNGGKTLDLNDRMFFHYEAY